MSPEDVAKWMMEELDAEDYLEQSYAASEIEDKFGEEFVYTNENGNTAIGKSVLSAFRKLSGDEVIWVRGDRAWRRRNEYDDPGRQQ